MKNDLIIILPMILPTLAGMAIIILGVFGGRRLAPWTALASVGGSAVSMFFVWRDYQYPFGSLLWTGPLAMQAGFAVTAAAAAAILMSVDYVRREKLPESEYYALMLLSMVGMLLLLTAMPNLLMLFLSVEMASLPLYVMAGMARRRTKSLEAAMKFFLLGSFASAILLYGAALVYGGSGSLNYAGIQAQTETMPSLSVVIGVGFIAVGLLFKVSLVPFQMWTPDVYEGAPSPVSAFMSVGTKIAAFFALMWLLAGWFWVPVVWSLSALTMVVGNIAAVAQKNIKRMLAYSSIAHAGYISVTIASFRSEMSMRAMVFYFIAYAFSNLGAWAVVAAVAKEGEKGTEISDYAGLFKTNPFLAAAMGLFMFSLAGIPPTAGFTAKLMVFFAALDAQMLSLAIIVVITTIISAYYYLRVTAEMFMVRTDEPNEVKVSLPTAAAIALCAAAVAVLFLIPGWATIWVR